MGVPIPAEVFRHGEGQAVSIPAGLELPAGGVTVRQDGPRLVIEQARVPLKAVNPANQPLLDLLASWDDLDEEFGPVDDPPPTSPKNLRELLESWEPISERIGPVEDLPPEPVAL